MLQVQPKNILKEEISGRRQKTTKPDNNYSTMNEKHLMVEDDRCAEWSIEHSDELSCRDKQEETKE